jgi:hypothetical protein
MLGLLTMTRDVICPKSLMLYKREVWRPLGNILVITSCRNLCPNSFQNFFVTQVSPKAQTLIIQRCIISFIAHSPLHQLLFLLIPNNITYNKAGTLPFQSCDWCHEYQFFKCPEQASYQLPSVTSHLVNTSVLQPSFSGNKRVLKWCNYHIVTSLNNVP